MGRPRHGVGRGGRFRFRHSVRLVLLSFRRVGVNSNSTREPMQPPPQLIQWLRQNYPKPSVDEVRVGVNILRARALTTPSFNLTSTGFRNVTLGWSRSTT